jgi:hypothetical protein
VRDYTVEMVGDLGSSESVQQSACRTYADWKLKIGTSVRALGKTTESGKIGGDWLGLSADEIGALEEDGII